LHRDRLTWLAYLQVSSFGYFLYAFGPTVSLLRDEQDISRTLSGLHGTALALGSLFSALLVPAAVRLRGRGTVMWSGLVIMCLGIVLYVATDALPLTLTGAMLGAFGGSFVIVPVAAVLTDHHGAAGGPALTEANALASAIGTVAPLIVGLAVATGLGWRAAMLLLLPLVALLRVFGRGVKFPNPEPEPSRHAASRRLPGKYWLGWVVVTAGIAVEFCMTLWAADILRTRYDLGPALASAGVTAVIGGMCVGRVVGGRLALRFAVDPLLYCALAVCAIGFTGFWLTTVAPLAITGLFVIGLGIAVVYPLGLSRAIALSDGQPDLAAARVGIGAALASGGGPFVLGALADHVGIHAAFLVVPALLLISALGIRLGTPRAAQRLAAA
jgi:predicted MFS family arabinose efflux permease